MQIAGLIENITTLSDVAIAAAAFVLTVITLAGAIRSGVMGRIRFGSFELEASKKETLEATRFIEAVTAPGTEIVPFETEQLASYYSQVLWTAEAGSTINGFA